MNWVVGFFAIVAAADVPQRVRQLRDYSRSQRLAVGAGLVAATVAFAAIATPILEALDVSSPTMEVAAGMVLILWSLVAFFRWTDEPAPPPAAGGLVPGLFPIVLTPVVGVVVVGVASRNGLPAPIAASVVVAVAIALATELAAAIGRRPARMASATAGVVLGIVMMTDGVLSV